MDKELRKKLVNTLKADKGFDPAYSAENRAWFCGAILDQIAKTIADKDLEKEARAIITNANARVKADRDFKVNLTLDPPKDKEERNNVMARVETIYGVIAQNKDFADTKFDTVRQFIVKRRYRGVVRMVHQVNPNANGFMRYPSDCPAAGGMQLNKNARPLWKFANPGSRVPLRVADQTDPKEAAEKIWSQPFLHPNECDGNLLDCGNGTGCVLMDTLFEATDTKKLFTEIKKRGANHILVINPSLRLLSSPPPPHLLWEEDNEPKKLFSKQVVPEEDLQIGDHIYLLNHGLYPNVAPNGAWTGEHALVTQCGNRKAGDGKGFKYNGHGLDEPRTVESLYDELVKFIQSFQHRLYTIADLFFSFRQNKIKIPEEDKELQTFTFNFSPEASVLAFKLVKPIRFNDYTQPPKGGKPATLSEGDDTLPLIIFEIPDRKEIRIAPTARDNTIERQKRFINRMSILVRKGDPPSGGSIFDKTLWQLPFKDTETLTQSFFPLFGGPKGAFKMLERNEMPKSKFGRRNTTDKGGETTRPTSETSATYVQFLRNIGAIP